MIEKALIFLGGIFLLILALLALGATQNAGLLAEGISNLGGYPEVDVEVPPLTRGELAGLPLTKHAASDHPERGMNAEAIRQSMLTGRCSPIEQWICATEIILTCPATESKTPGLILELFIGRSVRQIITGYPTTRPATSGCSGPVLLP